MELVNLEESERQISQANGCSVKPVKETLLVVL